MYDSTLKINVLILTILVIITSCLSLMDTITEKDFSGTQWHGTLKDGDTIKVTLQEDMDAQIKYRHEIYNSSWATINGKDASLGRLGIECEGKYVWSISLDGQISKKWSNLIYLKTMKHHSDTSAIIYWNYKNSNIEQQDTLFLN